MRMMSSQEICIIPLLLIFPIAVLQGNESTREILSRTNTGDAESRIILRVSDLDTSSPLPFRAVIKGSDGKFVDGSGRGTYDDGRFFADKTTTVIAPKGNTQIHISRGPEYHPLEFEFDNPENTETTIEVKLKRWISLADLDWYGGDNHVHSKHDSYTPIKTDLAYAALQGRAQGLNFITEAGSNVSYDKLDQLNTADFQIRYCGEIRPGPYVGHYNPAGLHEPLPKELYEKLTARPLPGQAIYPEVRKRGGIMIHTHPLMPRHQLHWMGASEAWSDAVANNMADLFDVDANHTERLWFALLNLGNRIGVSGHTDAALGRKRTKSPGDNRIYCRADSVDYDKFVESMRQGKTMATNGGPTFAFFTADGHHPGEVVKGRTRIHTTLKVESLNTIASAAIYQNGTRVAAFNVSGKQGPLELEKEIEIPTDRDSWLVARTQDKQGKWCLTGAIYFTPETPVPKKAASTVLFQIANITRFADLSRDYFAHIIATVRKPESIASVEIRNGDTIVKTYLPKDGDNLPTDGKIPTTGIFGNYTNGHIWHSSPKAPWHFQADLPVTESGWYQVHIHTTENRVIKSSEIHYDASNPLSQSISAATLSGPDTELTLWGYGTDIEIEKLHPKLNKGSWWYPGNQFWRIKTNFGGNESTLGWPTKQPVERFR